MNDKTLQILEKSPWTRPLAVLDIPENGFEIVIAADADILPRLAAFVGLTALESARASLRLERRGRHGVEAKGEVRACAIQTCVVSLEPFDLEIHAPIEAKFTPESKVGDAKPKRRGQVEAEPIDIDALPDFDPIIDGQLDLGALATEFLVLCLDPYPKKPGITFETKEIEPASSISPFASLAAVGRVDPTKK